MSRFLAYINKGKEAGSKDSFEPVQAVLRESTPSEIDVQIFSHHRIQVAHTGRVSIHLDESLGFLFILSGYFRQAGYSSAYSDDAKDLLPFFDGNRELFNEAFEGCFALVICNLSSLNVSLMTDRFGTRAIYYNLDEWHVVVSSDTDPIFPWLDKLSIPAKALTDSFWLGFIRAPETVVSGIAKVEDNTLVNINRKSNVEKCLQQHPLIMNPDPSLRFEDAVSRIEAALENEFAMLGKTNKRVAVLLSGGVDSSIMAAYAKRHFTECVAFSCEIEGFGNPELERAAYVADKLGLKHEIVRLKLDDLCGVFSEVVSMLEGPSRHINNLVVRRIFQEIKGYDAIIGGDGADALFGTKTNRTIANIEKKLALASRFPEPLKPIISMILGGISPLKRNHIKRILANDVESLLSNLFTIEYCEQQVSVAGKLGVSQFSNIPLVNYKSSGLVGRSTEANFSLFLRCMLERNTKLSNDSDIPIYYPFLSEDMIEIARRLPLAHRFDEVGNAKPTLREIFKRLVDSSSTEWPKVGFVTPEKSWLTNQLKPYLDDATSNRGGINKVLSLNLDSDDVPTSQSSKHMMWWLITLDASLLHMETQFSRWNKK